MLLSDFDTAGFEEGPAQSLSGRMRTQTEAALVSADAVMFLVDARAGLTPNDRAFDHRAAPDIGGGVDDGPNRPRPLAERDRG